MTAFKNPCLCGAPDCPRCFPQRVKIPPEVCIGCGKTIHSNTFMDGESSFFLDETEGPYCEKCWSRLSTDD